MQSCSWEQAHNKNSQRGQSGLWRIFRLIPEIWVWKYKFNSWKSEEDLSCTPVFEFQYMERQHWSLASKSYTSSFKYYILNSLSISFSCFLSFELLVVAKQWFSLQSCTLCLLKILSVKMQTNVSDMTNKMQKSCLTWRKAFLSDCRPTVDRQSVDVSSSSQLPKSLQHDVSIVVSVNLSQDF